MPNSRPLQKVWRMKEGRKEGRQEEGRKEGRKEGMKGRKEGKRTHKDLTESINFQNTSISVGRSINRLAPIAHRCSQKPFAHNLKLPDLSPPFVFS
jgi:hypothetical protein